jgi:hypothetical protein
MADAYQQWLQEQIEHWHGRVLESAARSGYPNNLRFADQTLREILDTYQECKANYEALMIRPTQTDAPPLPTQASD